MAEKLSLKIVFGLLSQTKKQIFSFTHQQTLYNKSFLLLTACISFKAISSVFITQKTCLWFLKNDLYLLGVQFVEKQTIFYYNVKERLSKSFNNNTFTYKR